MKTTRKSKINENALRSMLRKEISKLLEVEGEDDVQPEPKPKPKPEEEKQRLDPKLQAITSGYITKLKYRGAQVSTEELVEMLSNIIERFADTSEHKLNILQSIKTNIVH